MQPDESAGTKRGPKLRNAVLLHPLEGVKRHFKHNYPDAIKKLTKILPALKRLKTLQTKRFTIFFIGKSYWAPKIAGKRHYPT
jgi:hypothetical protein